MRFDASLRESGDFEIFRANDRELPVSPRLMPFQRAAKPVFGVIYRRHETRDGRQQFSAALVIYRADLDIAWRTPVPEKICRRRRKNYAVVLGDEIPDDRQVRRIVKNHPFLAVVHLLTYFGDSPLTIRYAEYNL